MASDLKAFELKADVRDGFAGGSFALGPNGETFDLAAELDRFGGIIVADDALVQSALAEHDHFKSALVPPSVRTAYGQVRDADGDDEASRYLRAGYDGPVEDPEPPELIDPEKHTREQLDDIASAELDDYDADAFDTKAAVADAINDHRKGA